MHETGNERWPYDYPSSITAWKWLFEHRSGASGAFKILFETQDRKDLSPKVIRGDLWIDYLTVAILGPIEARSACLFSPLWSLDNSSSASTWTQEVTWFWRDQGGTSANYVDHILTKIAADNYISEQTEEQSIVLSTEHRRPLPSTCISRPRQWRAIQFTTPPPSCAWISHLNTSGPSSLAANQTNSGFTSFFFFGWRTKSILFVSPW